MCIDIYIYVPHSTLVENIWYSFVVVWYVAHEQTPVVYSGQEPHIITM